uniref:Uncharacterized protein n=1 Tax=Micrurus paraensis TaxID=1970185 RepID=A0A2D4JZF2_9SAUR
MKEGPEQDGSNIWGKRKCLLGQRRERGTINIEDDPASLFCSFPHWEGAILGFPCLAAPPPFPAAHFLHFLLNSVQVVWGGGVAALATSSSSSLFCVVTFVQWQLAKKPASRTIKRLVSAGGPLIQVMLWCRLLFQPCM